MGIVMAAVSTQRFDPPSNPRDERMLDSARKLMDDALAGVVGAERDDHVGGTLHARPFVAPR
jgi:hypothetical protein